MTKQLFTNATSIKNRLKVRYICLPARQVRETKAVVITYLISIVGDNCVNLHVGKRVSVIRGSTLISG